MPSLARARLLLAFLLAFALLGVPPAQAQQQTEGDEGSPLTLEDIHASGAFYPNAFQSGTWADEGAVVTYIQSRQAQVGGEEQPVTHLVRRNLQTGERERIIDGTTLTPPGVDHPLLIEDYAYGPDEERLLLFTDAERVWRYKTKGYYYRYDLSSGALTPIAEREKGFQKFAKLSPSGDRVAFVRERNLFVTDLSSGEETQLTFDGADGEIINGTFDWVYEEEFSLRDGWRWSPSGDRIAFFKLDESQTRDFSLTNFQTRYPTYKEFRYPKAGEKNSEIKVGVIDMSTVGEEERPAIEYFDTQTWSDDYASEDERYEYIARMGWTPEMQGGAKVWMLRLNRDQNRLGLLYGDPQSMDVETVLTEQEDSYIDVSGAKINYLAGNDGAGDPGHFVFASENSGYRHLYLHDAATGERVRPITGGDWEVTGFHGLDRENGRAYVTGTRERSTERHLYRVPFSMEAASTAGQATRVTERPGTHAVDMAPSQDYFIDDFSAADTPPITTLHATPGGERLKVLEGNEDLRERLSGMAPLPEPTFTTVPGAGDDRLNAYLVKPTDFDASEQYPMLVYVYGGPGVQTVMNRWGGPRELWHKYLADELDVVVASVDNRGTGGRGKAFQDVPYGQLGVPEAADQQAAARHFADRSFVDGGRIGIWGWSYGGYLTLLSMLKDQGPQIFDAGMAVAPVTDWRFYDTIYTERYMSTPQKNPEGYDEGSPINYAENLREEQRLLMAHGDFDDNVHFQNSQQMAAALQEAGKQFEYMVYPGKDHGITGGGTRLHLFTMLTDFVRSELATPEEAIAAGEEDAEAVPTEGR
ncbi:MAG: S9 family peptidase [Bacteroidetes bacterium QS_9_68_14]|nr:MAG: S9 family peptidase [Bacteroidetes bacterium QS_9_68_14]